MREITPGVANVSAVKGAEDCPSSFDIFQEESVEDDVCCRR